MINRVVLLLCALLLFTSAVAKDSKTITLVVPFSPGSAQDTFARLISEPLSQELQTNVVVVNKPGGGGIVGAAFVAQANPDSQTYLIAASGHHLSGALHEKLTYHPLDSFRGVIFTGYSEFVLITSGELKATDLPSFVNLVKARPNAYNFASSGMGSTTHIGMASFLQKAGLQMVHLPLKGTSEIIHEVISGRVHAALVSTLSIQSYKNDARIRLIATTGLVRSENLSQLPTIAEIGFESFKWLPWTGILAPARTSSERLNEMNMKFRKVLSDSKMKQRLEQLGLNGSFMSANQFDRTLREDWFLTMDLIASLKLLAD